MAARRVAQGAMEAARAINPSAEKENRDTVADMADEDESRPSGLE
jgi:hypothetical protein